MPPATPQLLRGCKDILPADQPYWLGAFDTIRRIATNHGFERIETPVLEAAPFMTRAIGEAEDRAHELITFTDAHEDVVALRPHVTPGLVRAYIEHGFVNQPGPLKAWYFSPAFRETKPQTGRYRQFWQFGFATFGAAQPIVDAQIIMAARAVYASFGVETVVQINCLGDKTVRQQYGKALQAYFRTKKSDLTEEQRLLLQKSPLRLLAIKDPKMNELISEAPQIVDHLDEESRQHFVQVLEYLDEVEVPYNLNARLVRDADDATRTVFEFWAAQDEAGNMPLGGGGRYDHLVERLGGPVTPLSSFAGGVERLIMKSRELGQPAPAVARPEIFLAQLGEPARKKMLHLFEALQSKNIRLAEAMTKDGLKAQLEVATRLGAHFSLIIGQKEIMDDTVLIRDMENGIQEVVPYERAVLEITKRIEKTRSSGVVPTTGFVTPERIDQTPIMEEPAEQPFDGPPDEDNAE